MTADAAADTSAAAAGAGAGVGAGGVRQAAAAAGGEGAALLLLLLRGRRRAGQRQLARAVLVVMLVVLLQLRVRVLVRRSQQLRQHRRRGGGVEQRHSINAGAVAAGGAAARVHGGVKGADALQLQVLARQRLLAAEVRLLKPARLLQLPPCEAAEETLVQLETNLTTMPAITTMFNQGLTAADVTARILEGLGVLPEDVAITPTYGPCDEAELKKRMVRAVAALGKKEVADIIKQEGKLEVTCDLCQQTYQFSEVEVNTYIDEQMVARAEEA
ncbi:chaperonin [Tetrabaena socialis]|uniref:Chaperonin n=1 Tax=Tetrabaena socialis TaxID=47790 RepID=A0A2J7ZZG9_9CHLO|nr:chaperonin [Tetrabaena socialis]|eukprot:PNH05677.1 chaperonin [Tetrabaena socialis]